MDRRRKLLVPAAIVSVGALGFAALLATGPDVASEPAPRAAPLVRVAPVEPRSLELAVSTHGTVAPHTESELIPEVSGPVVWVSPSLVSGAFFDLGQPLLRIDPHDYRLALARARAQRARAQSEHDQAALDAQRQRGLADREYASPSQLDRAENAARVAAANLADARAAVAQAERDLARTELHAPYTGRVREEGVDVGQFVNRGNPIAVLYAIDYVEVRLPVSDEDLAFLDLPLWYRGNGAAEEVGPEVVLRARFAGAHHQWRGRVVRTEGEIDPRSRMVHVIARVEDPYGRSGGPDGRPPLAVGLFVEAEILGRRVDDVARVPRRALRDDRLLVVDREDRLRLRPATAVRPEGDDVLVRARFAPGDRVVISAPETAIDGMSVRPVPAGEAPS